VLLSNISGLNSIGLPWIVALGLAAFALYRRRTNEYSSHDTTPHDVAEAQTSAPEESFVAAKAREWGVLVAASVLFLSILAPHEIRMANDEALRYLFVLLPFLAALSGMFLWFVQRRMKLLAVALLVVLLGSNLLSLRPWGGVPRFLLSDYVAEVHQPYPTAYSEVMAFLNRHAQYNDKVLAVPQHMNYPLMFYIGDRVRFASVLNSKTHLPLDLIRSLPAPLLAEENFPDWYISFGKWPMTQRDLRFFSRPHTRNGRRIEYSYRLHSTLDVLYEQAHRPEIPWHSFGPHRSFDRSKHAVYIYRRSAPRVLE
jgi:hypothetical protein